MNSNDTFLLEAKLKRLKISFSKENGKIIIGKAKFDAIYVFGLIAFPVVSAIAAIIFLQVIELDLRQQMGEKVYLGIFFLFFVGIVSFFRYRKKIKDNQTTKILGYKEIIIKTKEDSRRFDAFAIDKFEYSVQETGKESCHARLFLIDSYQDAHLLLGFDAENEQYAIDDLQWFANYFESYL